jgi:hypothetical protein
MVELRLGYATNVPRISQLNPRLREYAEAIVAVIALDGQRTRNGGALFQAPHEDRYAECSAAALP